MCFLCGHATRIAGEPWSSPVTSCVVGGTARAFERQARLAFTTRFVLLLFCRRGSVCRSHSQRMTNDQLDPGEMRQGITVISSVLEHRQDFFLLSGPIGSVLRDFLAHRLWRELCGGSVNASEKRKYMCSVVVAALWVPGWRRNKGSASADGCVCVCVGV